MDSAQVGPVFTAADKGHFPLLLHASVTACHYMLLQHHHYRRSEEEAEAIFVQPQFPHPDLLFPTAATLFSA